MHDCIKSEFLLVLVVVSRWSVNEALMHLFLGNTFMSLLMHMFLGNTFYVFIDAHVLGEHILCLYDAYVLREHILCLYSCICSWGTYRRNIIEVCKL